MPLVLVVWSNGSVRLAESDKNVPMVDWLAGWCEEVIAYYQLLVNVNVKCE